MWHDVVVKRYHAFFMLIRHFERHISGLWKIFGYKKTQKSRHICHRRGGRQIIYKIVLVISLYHKS